MVEAAPQSSRQQPPRSNFRRRSWKRDTWVHQPQPEVITIQFNDEKHGVEILFPGEPSDAIKVEMKANSFRYIYRGQHIWYCRRSTESVLYAEKLKARLEAPPSVETFLGADI